MRLLVLGHLGIGDHIMMNGLLHFLMKHDEQGLEEICIIAMDDYRKTTLVHMYEDFPKFTFYWIKSLQDDLVFQKTNQKPSGTIVSLDGKHYSLLTFGLHSDLKNNWLLPGLNWIDALYKYPLSIPPQMRFLEFHCPSNLQRSLDKYEKLLQALGTSKYVLLHDDPSRNRLMNYKTVQHLMKEDGMSDYPIVYLGKDRYKYPFVDGTTPIPLDNLLECESLFDLTHIVRGAAACHLMDSSIACLVDVLQVNSKLYCHSYMMWNTGKAFTRMPWVRIESD